jgi:hypothetical protein
MGTDPQLPGRAEQPSGAEPSLPYRMSDAARHAFARIHSELGKAEIHRWPEFMEERIRDWTDDAILAELRAMPMLPERLSGVPDECFDEVYDRFLLLDSIAEVAAERKLLPAVPLLLFMGADEVDWLFGSYHHDTIAEAAGGDWEYLTRCCVEAILRGGNSARGCALAVLLKVPAAEASQLGPLLLPAIDVAIAEFPDYARWTIKHFGLASRKAEAG